MAEIDYADAARKAFEAVVEKNGRNVVLLRVEPYVSYTDYVLLATGTSDRHVSTLASEVEDVLGELGLFPLGKEGVDRGFWALLDFGFMVVHVLQRDAREYYQIDTLWPQAVEIATHAGDDGEEEWEDDDDWDDEWGGDDPAE